MLPQKTREIQSHHFDSTKWNSLKIRDDDMIVATAYKSGTTWMQNILLALQYQGRELPKEDVCPWFDLRVPPLEVQLPFIESQTERRQLKTHLPLDALVFSPKAKYVYIGRDGRDCFMSLVNHYQKGNDLWYQVLNDSPGRVGDPLPRWSDMNYTAETLFDDWISKGWPSIPGETDGYPWWSLFDNVASWWKYRHLDNILFIHFNDMLEDLSGSIRRIAAFFEFPIDEANFPALVESLTFDGMKKQVDKVYVPLQGAIFEGGANSFINKGTNGRWRGVLSEAQLAKYNEVCAAKLTPECRAWLEHGEKGYDPKS